MVNLAAMVWRRLLRKRWVLALVFGLSLVYFLTSTFKQVSGLSPSRVRCGRRGQLGRPPAFLPGSGRVGFPIPGTEAARGDLLPRGCLGRRPGLEPGAAGPSARACYPRAPARFPPAPPAGVSSLILGGSSVRGPGVAPCDRRETATPRAELAGPASGRAPRPALRVCPSFNPGTQRPPGETPQDP